ncbi:MAG: aromatic ring-hydroxylating dioxygenase subunit alpha, partial [Gammaproteobacteria bacterium]|nr:aromatic ring-hydroxylating dioxygenase subunit alpha [Gammaproteobacteria bacterium]
MRKPVLLMRALSNDFYISREKFIEERERVFAPMWTCIGFASDAPNAGDVKPVTFME